MAFRPLLRQRPLSPLAVGAVAAGVLLFPHSTLHAEAPPDEHLIRKPIYDDLALTSPPAESSSPSNDESPPNPTSTTYTDRLAGRIGHVRKFIHAHSALAEDRVNAFMSSVLHQEQAFTQTIASLAPSPESRERVAPGALYVFVGAMTGSILSRNRNILLRASLPFAIGLGTAWYALPVTTRNVADLVWTYEEKAPLVSVNHMRVRGAVEEGWKQSKIRMEILNKWSEERVRANREAIERWIRKE